MTASEITYAEVQQIRQNTIFQGDVTRDQVKRLAQSWLALNRAITAASGVHAPIDALHTDTGRVRKVCTGCGTDAGNWQPWPCPTIRGIDSAAALAEANDPQ